MSAVSIIGYIEGVGICACAIFVAVQAWLMRRERLARERDHWRLP